MHICQDYIHEFLTKVTNMRGLEIDLKDSIMRRMAASSPFGVWVPADFVDLEPRDALDQVLHRLVRAGMIRRITRGLYDKPNLNALTGKSTHPEPRSIIDALARRDSSRMIVDGITAANDIGLSDAVPANIIVHTDARLKALALGNLVIDFKKLPPANCSGPDDRPCASCRHSTGCAIHWTASGPRLLFRGAPRFRKLPASFRVSVRT